MAKLIGKYSEKQSIVARGSITLQLFFTPQIVRKKFNFFKNKNK
jgi:hypothetical protein